MNEQPPVPQNVLMFRELLRYSHPKVKHLVYTRDDLLPPILLVGALQDNANIRTVLLDCDCPIRESNATNSDARAVSDNDDDDEPMHSFLKEAVTLRTVQIGGRCEQASGWIDAMAANQTIEEIDFMAPHTRVSKASLSRFLTMSSLKRLKIYFKRFCKALAEFDQARSNDNLEHLCLKDIRTDEPMSIIAILQYLRDYRRLCSLELEFSDDVDYLDDNNRIMTAISLFMIYSTVLEELSFADCKWNQAAMELFMQGLSASRSLVRLAFTDCEFPLQVSQVLVTHIQNANASGTSRIRSLQFKWNGVLPGDRGQEHGRMIAQIVSGPHGSGVTAVHVSSVSVMGLWSALATDGSFHENTSLDSLRIRDGAMSGSDLLHVDRPAIEEQFGAAKQIIPSLLNLRSLEWELPEEIATQEACKCIRMNGSLHHVTLRSYSGFAAESDPQHERLLAAIGERNRHLPTLLSQEKNRALARTLEDANEAAVAAHSPARLAARSAALLFPALCVTAHEIPRMALGHVLRGTLAMDE